MVYENLGATRLTGLSGFEGKTFLIGLGNDDVIFVACSFLDFVAITGCENFPAVAFSKDGFDRLEDSRVILVLLGL